MLNRVFSQRWAVPLLTLGVLVAAFGLLIPQLGYYWDDWPLVFLSHTEGAAGFVDFLAYDRPISAWMYLLTMPLLGTRPIVWHLFALLMRWLAVLAFWQVLRLLWPNRARQTGWMALLFAVYPVFFQQSIAVIYSHVWLLYLVFFVSLLAMLRAQQGRFWLWTIIAVFTQLLHLLTIEYFAGLEILRVLMLWLVLGQKYPDWRQRLRHTAIQWLPYLLGLLAFVIWRLFFLNLPDDPNASRWLPAFRANPLATLLEFSTQALGDLVHVSVATWYQTLAPELFDLSSPFGVASWLVVLVVVVGLFLLVSRVFSSDSEDGQDANWTQQALLFAAAALLLGLLPTWYAGREIIGGLYSDRFALPAMVGGSVLFVALAEWLLAQRWQKTLLLSLLVGLAVGAHLRAGNLYRLDWEKQTRFYWQMLWRAPGLQPGTSIISDGSIFGYVTEYSSATAINTLYPQSANRDGQSYWFFELYGGIHHDIEGFVAGQTLDFELRTLNFSGSSLDSLVIYYEPFGRCLWVLDENEASHVEIPDITQEVLSVSNLARIELDGMQPPPAIFGTEPEHTWCYYYQKADLAAQLGDWAEVLELEEQAATHRVNADSQFEMLPFIEAYAKLGNWPVAGQLSQDAFKRQRNVQQVLCNTWQRLLDETEATPERQLALDEVTESLSCPLP